MPATRAGSAATTHPAVLVLGGTRAAVGVLAWAAPGRTMRLTGLGPAAAGAADAAASAGVVTRLFSSRDLALGWALLQPDPGVRTTALRVGLAVDLVDAAASVLGVRRGAHRASLVGVAAGALLLAALGAAALQAGQGA